MTFLSLDLFLWILLIESCIVTPVLGLRYMSGLRAAVAAGDEGARLRAYRRTIVMEWLMTTAFLVAWLWLGRGLGDLRLLPQAAGWQWLAIAIGLGAAGFVAWQSHRASCDVEQLKDLRGKLGKLESIVPQNEPEMRRFTWLSLTAGICEEIRYRGLLLGALAAVVGLWPAVILSSIAFGIGHSYQGGGGILKTGLIGLAMALVVVFSGSLFAAIIVHAVIDMAQGRMLYKVMVFDERPAVLTASAG